jgi:hypothetical protein
MAEIDAFKLSELKKSEKETIAANAAAATFVKKDPVTNKVTQYTPTTEEYYESLGGIDRKTGAYGYAVKAAEEQFRPYLTYEEQAVATEGLTGVARGQAINLATRKKQYDLAISRGLTPAEAAEFSGYDPVTNSIKFVSSSSGDTGGTGFGSSSSAANLAAQQAAQAAAEKKRKDGQSAYDLLFLEFDRYGLGALIEPLKGFIQDGLSGPELTLQLRASKPYQERFAANPKRIAAGFRAIDEATYLGLEDKYQSIFQNYGLPPSYYEKGYLGVQKGFEDLIGGNVDPVTLEERIIEGQKVTKGNQSIINTAKEFFPNLTDGDFLAYVLNPKNALDEIKRKVTSVEIGAGAMQAGLKTGLARAEELQRAGVTKETAQQGFGVIADGLERGRQLSNIYQQPDYTQQVAETEVFGLTGKTEAKKQRNKLARLETATFGGTSGAAGGALSRERAGQY